MSIFDKWGLLESVLTEKKLESKCRRVMNMSTSSTRPPSCMYCFGELSPMEGTPANMLFPSERDSASSRSRPPPRARFLGEERGWLFLDGACQTSSQSSKMMSGIQSKVKWGCCNCVFFSISISISFFQLTTSSCSEWKKMRNAHHNTAYVVFGILDLVF